MCLAVPGQIMECGETEALVDLQGNRLKICTALTPEVGPGDWVLIHAGFSITALSDQDALETWDYLEQVFGGAGDAIGEHGLGAQPERGSP